MCVESLSCLLYKSRFTTEWLCVQQTIKEAIGCKVSGSLEEEAIFVTLRTSSTNRELLFLH